MFGFVEVWQNPKNEKEVLYRFTVEEKQVIENKVDAIQLTIADLKVQIERACTVINDSEVKEKLSSFKRTLSLET